jgi:hypothetical protein
LFALMQMSLKRASGLSEHGRAGSEAAINRVWAFPWRLISIYGHSKAKRREGKQRTVSHSQLAMPVVRSEETEGSDDPETFIPKIAMQGTARDGYDANGLFPVLSPEAELAMKKTSHLVERICERHGVSAQAPGFASGAVDADELVAWSGIGHGGAARIAEYLQRRVQLEKDYAAGLQRLNRSTMAAAGDASAHERLGELVVMSERTAAGHADFAARIDGERIAAELRAMISGNEEARRSLVNEIKRHRAAWRRAVTAFEKVHRSCERTVGAELAAYEILRSPANGTVHSQSTLRRLQADYQQKRVKGNEARAAFAEAREALNARHREIFTVHLPGCYGALERLERARLAATRAALLRTAQAQLAMARAVLDDGSRWVQRLVEESVDDEIGRFVRAARGEGAAEMPLDALPLAETTEGDMAGAAVEVTCYEHEHEHEPVIDLTVPEETPDAHTEEQTAVPVTGSAFAGDDRRVLEAREQALLLHLEKLEQQRAGLARMRDAYNTGDAHDADARAAIVDSLQAVEKELKAARRLERGLVVDAGQETESRNEGSLEAFAESSALDSYAEILTALQKIEQEAAGLEQKAPRPRAAIRVAKEKKKCLSKSFEDVMRAASEEPGPGIGAGLGAGAVGPLRNTKLPGSQNVTEELHAANRPTAGRSRSASLSTPNPDPSLQRGSSPQPLEIEEPQQLQDTEPRTDRLVPLFRVQALYNFAGRRETDELDLHTGEVLMVLSDEGEWWEAENGRGERGYIPFNYVLRLRADSRV